MWKPEGVESMSTHRASIDATARLELQETVTKMFVAADRRDWSALREVLAAEVYLDYASLNGGEPVTIAADDVVAGWTDALSGLTATQHLIDNILVESAEEDEATVTCYAQATHFLPDSFGSSLWTLGAHYLFVLRYTQQGWRIAAVTLTTVWGDGNQQLMTKAQASRDSAAGSADPAD
jgi:SnoaL-like domain